MSNIKKLTPILTIFLGKDEHYSIMYAAKLYGCGVWKIRYEIKKNKLKTIRFGKNNLIDYETLIKLRNAIVK